MRLYVPTMDAVVTEFDSSRRVRFDGDNGWSNPSVQERRAIIHAAEEELANLRELLEVMEREV